MSLLFFCYVNDMYTSSVDDSAILFAHKDPEVISQKVSKVMESCSDWLIDNKLSLHLGKAKCGCFFVVVVLFFFVCLFFFWGGGWGVGGTRRKLKKIINFNVKRKEQIIKSQYSVRYLGLHEL